MCLAVASRHGEKDIKDKTYTISKILRAFEWTDSKYVVSKLTVENDMNLNNVRLGIEGKKNFLKVCSNVCQQYRKFIVQQKRKSVLGIYVDYPL